MMEMDGEFLLLNILGSIAYMCLGRKLKRRLNRRPWSVVNMTSGLDSDRKSLLYQI